MILAKDELEKTKKIDREINGDDLIYKTDP